MGKTPRARKSTTPVEKQKRMKTGCFTCRIRRKKCDEIRDRYERCGCCIRLNIQCLGGFGLKRDDRLKSKETVDELRKRIKEFLSAKGTMRNSGSLSVDSDGTLILDRETYRFSVSPEGGSPQSDYMSPLVSDQGSFDSPVPGHYLQLQTAYDSDVHDDGSFLPVIAAPFLHEGLSSDQILVSSTPSPWTGIYHFVPTPDDQYDFNNNIPATEESFPLPAVVPQGGDFAFDDHLGWYYIQNTFQMQYLLADEKISAILLGETQRGRVGAEAARLLAAIHQERSSMLPSHQISILRGSQNSSTGILYNRLRSMLAPDSSLRYSEDAVIASLNVISAVLFDGGEALWPEWLMIGHEHCRRVLQHRPIVKFSTCNDVSRLLVKISIWFDILASVTTQRPPLNYAYIEQLFSPTGTSRVEDTSAQRDDADKLSMLPVMGCDNTVAWALSATTHLAWWKQEQLASGTLSYPRLVALGAEIQRHLSAIDPLPSVDDGVADHSNARNSKAQVARRYTSGLFRTAAGVYLSSVLSGNFPHVKEIEDGVYSMMQQLGELRRFADIPRGREVVSSVVRSAVFPIFITCALAETEQKATQIMSILEFGSGAGNCCTVSNLLSELWLERRTHNLGQSDKDVPWRKMLACRMMLLV